MKPTLKPSDLEREALRLIKEGKMPTLQQVMDVIAGVKHNPHVVAPHDFDGDAETMLIRNRTRRTKQ
jgi:hypothetical protein